jgi:tRNA pseudouridine13 synthase
LRVPKLDKALGIEVYATKSPGIGGRIRQLPEDFVVEEILLDGSKANIAPKDVPKPIGLGRYLICGLVKCNWDTLLAVRTIAQQLGMSQERIQIAGIKDANALTAQHISISRTTPDMISKVKIKDIKLYPIRFSNEKMHSTLLYGNQFHIVIRLIDRSQSEIMERMQNVKHDLESPGGIPNFFGHQRFGTTRPITHIVGRHIVQGRWEEAALAFLAESSEYEHPESRQARQQLWQERNFSEALHYFPSQLKYERIMLSHLARHPKESVNAFRRLPIKLCELFVQAYQSYLFNKFLSQRMKLRMSISQPQDGDFTVKVNKKEHLALPIIGFKQSQSSGDQGEIEREILEKEKVAPQQFRIALMPEISAAGGIRTALSPIMDFSIGEPNIDSANPSKRMVRLGFMLGKGSYATVALREFMKSGNPVDAGF